MVKNYIENVNMEVDYDKLAKAIVKAQETVKDADNDLQRKKIGFWKALKEACIESRKSKGQITAMALAYFTQVILTVFSCIFAIMTLVGILGFGFSFYYAVTVALSTGNAVNVIDIVAAILVAILFLAFTILCAIFGLTLFGAANEITYEKDRNYVVAILSAMTSFSAMVVALVTLFCTKGS